MGSKINSDIFVFFIDKYRFLELQMYRNYTQLLYCIVLYTHGGKKFIKCKIAKLKKAVAAEGSKVPCTDI